MHECKIVGAHFRFWSPKKLQNVIPLVFSPMWVNWARFSVSEFPDNVNYCWKEEPRVIIVFSVFQQPGNNIFKVNEFFWAVPRFNRVQKTFLYFFLGDLLQNISHLNSWRKSEGFCDTQFMIGEAAGFFGVFNTFTPSINQKFVVIRVADDAAL